MADRSRVKAAGPDPSAHHTPGKPRVVDIHELPPRFGAEGARAELQCLRAAAEEIDTHRLWPAAPHAEAAVSNTRSNSTAHFCWKSGGV
jgi:hypothetical protein